MAKKWQEMAVKRPFISLTYSHLVLDEIYLNVSSYKVAYKNMSQMKNHKDLSPIVKNNN